MPLLRVRSRCAAPRVGARLLTHYAPDRLHVLLLQLGTTVNPIEWLIVGAAWSVFYGPKWHVSPALIAAASLIIGEGDRRG